MPGEGAYGTIEQEAECAPEPVWILWRRDKSIVPAEN